MPNPSARRATARPTWPRPRMPNRLPLILAASGKCSCSQPPARTVGNADPSRRRQHQPQRQVGDILGQHTGGRRNPNRARAGAFQINRVGADAVDGDESMVSLPAPCAPPVTMARTEEPIAAMSAARSCAATGGAHSRRHRAALPPRASSVRSAIHVVSCRAPIGQVRNVGTQPLQ
jgi:hypothetical protein